MTNCLANYSNTICILYYINADSKANEQFYPPTNDDKPLAFGDFVVVRLTTESTEDLASITLRVTKSQSVSLDFGIL